MATEKLQSSPTNEKGGIEGKIDGVSEQGYSSPIKRKKSVEDKDAFSDIVEESSEEMMFREHLKKLATKYTDFSPIKSPKKVKSSIITVCA